MKYGIIAEGKEWQIVHCTRPKSRSSDLEAIRSIITEEYIGKFNASEHTCIDAPGITDDRHLYITVNYLSGVMNIWEVGGLLKDINGFSIPGTYRVRRVGIFLQQRK